MTNTDELMKVLQRSFDELVQSNSESIDTKVVADRAMAMMDPDDRAPILVRLAATLEMRQLARSLCRMKIDNEKIEAIRKPEQYQLLDDKLQDYYPVKRKGQEVYMLRTSMTAEDYVANIARLRAEADAKNKHADALEEELNQLIKAGILQEIEYSSEA